jgi:acetyl-CoA synthetase (ADP-forming)
MVRGARELIAGLVRDPKFGPCVMLGLGGVLAEAVADVVFRLVPVSDADADEMIDDLDTQALLHAFRGEPAVDRTELRRVLVGLSRLAESDRSIVAVDLNPLIVSGGRPVAVDALVEVSQRS